MFIGCIDPKIYNILVLSISFTNFGKNIIKKQQLVVKIRHFSLPKNTIHFRRKSIY